MNVSEPDCCTVALTKWLASDVNNVYYLSVVINEYQPADGFQALTMARGKAIEQIWLSTHQTLLNFLNELID